MPCTDHQALNYESSTEASDAEDCNAWLLTKYPTTTDEIEWSVVDGCCYNITAINASILSGDTNNDGTLNVLDLVTSVNTILGTLDETYYDFPVLL